MIFMGGAKDMFGRMHNYNSLRCLSKLQSKQLWLDHSYLGTTIREVLGSTR